MKPKILGTALLAVTGILLAAPLAHANGIVCVTTVDVTPGRYLDKIRVTNQQELLLPVAGRIMDRNGNTVGNSFPFTPLEPQHSVTLTLQQVFAAAGVGYNPNYLIEISHHPETYSTPDGVFVQPTLQGAYISQGTSIPAAPLLFTCRQPAG